MLGDFITHSLLHDSPINLDVFIISLFMLFIKSSYDPEKKPNDPHGGCYQQVKITVLKELLKENTQ